VAEVEILFVAKQAALFFSRPFDQPFDGFSLSFQISLEAPAVTPPIPIVTIFVPDVPRAPEFGHMLIFDAVFLQHGCQRRLGKSRLPTDRQFPDVHNH